METLNGLVHGYVSAHPLMSLGGAFIMGVLTAFLALRKKSSEKKG